MTNYKVIKTEEFNRKFNKLDNSLKIQIENEIRQLINNPYVGKALGYRFLREKKIRGYRIYYLIYDEYLIVYLVDIGDKNEQQFIINKIKYLRSFYKEEIKTKFNL